MIDWYMYPAVILVGFAAGFINTLAGGGSALSLPFLIFLGLPANVANGTNRIAILLQNVIGSRGYHREKVLDLRKGFSLGFAAVLGAVPGALFAISLNEFIMRKVVGAVLVVMLLLVLFKPGIWLKSRAGSVSSSNKWVSFIVFFLIGAYGGFIQAGTGFFLLAGLVMIEGMDLLRSNAIKVFLVLLYTPLALLVFILNKQVDYKLGLVLAVGNMAGAWLGSKVAVSWGPKFIRWILIVALTGSILKLFEVF
jgi:uncharacterized membrane protein YfcA